jgi:hypothetical protein
MTSRDTLAEMGHTMDAAVRRAEAQRPKKPARFLRFEAGASEVWHAVHKWRRVDADVEAFFERDLHTHCNITAWAHALYQWCEFRATFESLFTRSRRWTECDNDAAPRASVHAALQTLNRLLGYLRVCCARNDRNEVYRVLRLLRMLMNGDGICRKNAVLRDGLYVFFTGAEAGHASVSLRERLRVICGGPSPLENMP